MTDFSTDFSDDDFSFLDWGIGVYPPAVIREPDMSTVIRKAEAKRAGLKLWESVQKELVRRA